MDAPSEGKSTIKGKTYTPLPPPYFLIKIRGGGAYQFTTRSIPEWNDLHALWYVGKTKVVPCNIFDILSPVSLAYWHMDDGGWTKGGIHLSTNSFTLFTKRETK